MRLYGFKSGVNSDLRASAGDMSGSKLPEKLRPWHADGAEGREDSMAHATKTDDRADGHTRAQTRDLNGFDYNASAELFLGRSKAAKSRPKYIRFDTAAEAVRFVIESLPAAALPGAYLLVEEARFGVDEIRYLYDGASYPLPRAIEKC
jgi:hypothetical protein